MLKDTYRDDITLGWYDAGGKFRKGKVTWPNVREARHEGPLFAKFGDNDVWRTVISDPSNDQMIECLSEPVAELIELLLYEVEE